MSNPEKKPTEILEITDTEAIAKLIKRLEGGDMQNIELTLVFQNGLGVSAIRGWLDAINDKALRPENMELVLQNMERVRGDLKVTIAARPYREIGDTE